jgi:hypothetical protein
MCERPNRCARNRGDEDRTRGRHLVYSLSDGCLPAACSSSDTDSDREVMRVSKSAASPRAVFWNIEPED